MRLSCRNSLRVWATTALLAVLIGCASAVHGQGLKRSVLCSVGGSSNSVTFSKMCMVTTYVIIRMKDKHTIFFIESHIYKMNLDKKNQINAVQTLLEITYV